MQAHAFRKDLYYRLNVATLTMPRLSEIREDIPLLVEHFLEKVAREQNTAPKKVSPEVMSYLINKEWPGNIRELENTIRGWNAMTLESSIAADLVALDTETLATAANDADFDRPYKELKDEAIQAFTLKYLYRLLNYTKGNVTLSAQISGIKRQSLQKIINRYGVPVDDYRN